MQPLEKLLRKLKCEGTSLPPWMMPLGNEVITYNGVNYMRGEALKKLCKDEGDDSEDEDDAGSADSSSASGYDSNTSAGNGNYNPDEPRIPAGQPGGGQWTTDGSGVSSEAGNNAGSNNIITQTGPLIPAAYTTVQSSTSNGWTRAWENQSNQDLREFIANEEQPDVEHHPSYGYDNVNADTNALGRYQFLKGSLVDLGLKNDDGSWRTDTPFYDAYKIDSDQKFLNNEQAQEDVMTAFIARQEDLTRSAYQEFGEETYNGQGGKDDDITVTQAGLIAAAHEEGYKNVNRYFAKFGAQDIPNGYVESNAENQIETRLRGAQSIEYQSAGWPKTIPNPRKHSYSA